MKTLIWVGCIFVLSISTLLIKNVGIVMGGIPTVLMFGGMWWLAQTLSAKWDEKTRKSSDDEEETEKRSEDK